MRHFDEFGDVAEHCTVCHKCFNPCPVDIDFGDVSIAMRNLLRRQGHEPMPGGLPKRSARALLDIEDSTVVPIIRNPAARSRY